MADGTTQKKKTSPLLFVGIGCLALLFLIGAGTTVILKFFAKSAIQGVIENKTGIKTNLQDAANGKITFTDTKTGAKVDIGSGKVPDTFPKDFPLYPGAKVTSAMSGAQSGQNNGFWMTMTTADSLDKVDAFYKAQFATSGWTISTTYTTGGTTSDTVEKGQWTGTLALSADSSTKETQIVIILGQQEVTPTETP
jgi:hypothetical protein